MRAPSLTDFREVSESEARAFLGRLHAERDREEIEKDKIKLRRRRTAQRELAAEEAAGDPTPPEALTVAEVRARPAGPSARVNTLIPARANTLIVAKRKTGKTTFLLNLARSLITGEPMLGELAVEKVGGRVAVLNYEMDEAQVATWAAEVGELDTLLLVPLRGRRNPLTTPEDRAALAQQLRDYDVEVIVVDTFSRAFSGGSQNDASEVMRFLGDLDVFARGECGASDLVLTAHAGWASDRTRGSSALEDWPDSILYLTVLDEEDPTSPRYLSARGRDVDLEEHRLDFDQQTRRLTLGSRETKTDARYTRKHEQLVPLVAGALRAKGASGLTSTELIAAVRALKGAGSDTDIRRAAAIAVDRGLVDVNDGGVGRAKLFTIVDTPDDPGTTSDSER